MLVDSHFHWLPKQVEDDLQKLRGQAFRHTAEWWDLPGQLEHMDSTGRRIDVICSGGVATAHYAEIEVAAARELTRAYNEEMADAQQRYRGRVWGTCVLPLQDTAAAMTELDHAVATLGLVGVSLPARVGEGEFVDAPRLESFYDRVEQLGVPLVLHPTDNVFADGLAGYGGALHLGIGRVVDVSVCAMRLILSGVMERHPDLKVLISHTGGALPYQAGRLDKNSAAASLPERPSSYLKRMYTDTVSPGVADKQAASGLAFAIAFFGADRVLFGDDHPCWDTRAALDQFDALNISDSDRARIASANAVQVFGLTAAGAAGDGR